MPLGSGKETPYSRLTIIRFGYLLANSLNAPDKARKTLSKSLSSISKQSAWKGKIIPINTREDIKAVAPALDGPMKWKGYFNQFAGYAHAGDALHATYAACCDSGVTFVLGDSVEKLSWKGNECVGVVTASGKVHQADTVVVTLGASAARLIPELSSQVAVKAWSVAHVQLSPSEAEALRNIPVTYARDLGFLFEPDSRTHLLKMCPSGAGITNFSGSRVSLPPADSSYIPEHDEEAMRRLLPGGGGYGKLGDFNGLNKVDGQTTGYSEHVPRANGSLREYGSTQRASN